MAVFTRVTESDLATWLKNYSLGQPLELQGITSGIENTNYFVTTSVGRFVLTLFEKLAARELPFYVNLMSHLSRHNVPCPSPMLNNSAQFISELNGKPACIVSRLPGKSLTQPGTTHCSAIGKVLGQLHNATQDFTETMPNARGSAWRLHTAQQTTPFLSPQDTLLLSSEIKFHQKHTLSALPQGVIHADLFRDNVLFDGAKIGGLIDFYFACNDCLLYDLAITVNDWCVSADHTLDKARTQALLQAYHAVRPLKEEERDAWSTALRVAALRFWLSRLHDMHLPRNSELVHAHDPNKFKHILQQHIHMCGNIVWL